MTGRTARMLSRFPAFMRAETSEKVLSDIVSATGTDLDETERLMTGIQRAHRLMVADEERDVLQLAALLGLRRGDFLILRKLYEKGFFRKGVATAKDAQDREEQAYAAYLAELKESVQRIARVMMDGCGTIRALLEGTSILLNADTTGPVEHPDPEGFVHRLPIIYKLVEKIDGEEKLVPKERALYLVENPLIDRFTDETERRQQERFIVKRKGFFPVSTAVLVTGMADRTIFPMLINVTTHEGVGFRGVVADGQKLLFAADGRAYLDGVEVTDRCYYFTGAVVDDLHNDGSTRIVDPAAPAADVRVKDGFCRVTPAGSLDRNYPRPTITPVTELPVPTLPLGDSDWRFSVEEGAFDASGFDEAVFAPAVGDGWAPYPPSAKVQLNWQENEPFAVTVRVPRELKSLDDTVLDAKSGEELLTLLQGGLERFRAAGIKLTVDYFDDTWILNQSILRSLKAKAGDGIYFDGTKFGELPIN